VWRLTLRVTWKECAEVSQQAGTGWHLNSKNYLIQWPPHSLFGIPIPYSVMLSSVGPGLPCLRDVY
jgi:hypothetical protein